MCDWFEHTIAINGLAGAELQREQVYWVLCAKGPIWVYLIMVESWKTNIPEKNFCGQKSDYWPKKKVTSKKIKTYKRMVNLRTPAVLS